MNLKQLSSMLDLSQTTVSRALNGYPEVNEETRRRVMDAAKRHGYRPNPSARRLATGTTNITWGQEIATTFGLGPRIYLVLFLVGLVVMYFFSITPVTAAAAGTLFGASALYQAVTGVPYFVPCKRTPCSTGASLRRSTSPCWTEVPARGFGCAAACGSPRGAPSAHQHGTTSR